MWTYRPLVFITCFSMIHSFHSSCRIVRSIIPAFSFSDFLAETDPYIYEALMFFSLIHQSFSIWNNHFYQRSNTCTTLIYWQILMFRNLLYFLKWRCFLFSPFIFYSERKQNIHYNLFVILSRFFRHFCRSGWFDGNDCCAISTARL